MKTCPKNELNIVCKIQYTWFIYIKEYFSAALIEHYSVKFRIHFRRIMSAREQDRMKIFRAYSMPKNSRNFSYPRKKIEGKMKVFQNRESSEIRFKSFLDFRFLLVR